MLCISKHSRYRLPLRGGGRPQYNLQGHIIHQDRPLEAEFKPGGGLEPWAQDMALSRFAPWKGLPQGLEPLETIGWFDSDLFAQELSLSPEEKQAVENRLRELEQQYGGEFFIAEKPLAKVPGGLENYPKITTVVGRRTQEHVVDKLRELVDDLGLSPEEIVAYETDHPRPESEFIIRAVTPPVVEEAVEERVLA